MGAGAVPVELGRWQLRTALRALCEHPPGSILAVEAHPKAVVTLDVDLGRVTGFP